ncbi:alpha/beta fold hydrolase [Pandoraea pulmonicola]|uniref:alpha/beta fold hydrolase n=1 Tax=Pandoraea pulmonicola TaxID=93221 RepID=UPI003AAE3117
MHRVDLLRQRRSTAAHCRRRHLPWRNRAIVSLGFAPSSRVPRHALAHDAIATLANNTHALLASLGIQDVTIIGHSTGGMLAVRYALMYPAETQQLVLVNPITFHRRKCRRASAITQRWRKRRRRPSPIRSPWSFRNSVTRLRCRTPPCFTRRCLTGWLRCADAEVVCIVRPPSPPRSIEVAGGRQRCL